MSQLFINILGHNGSGKTTLAKRLEDELLLNRISGDDFRKFIHTVIPYFHDTDISYPNKRYSELSPIVLQYRFDITDLLLKAGQTVIFDGSGSTKVYREHYLSHVQTDFPKVKRVIIWADIAEDELLERLAQRGESWVRQYYDFRKPSFEPPTDSEADVVLRYNQHNYDEIKQATKGLLT